MIRQRILKRLASISEAVQRRMNGPEQVVAESVEPRGQSEEQKSKAELKRLRNLIEDQKQIARETDISYHLWGLYKSHFRVNSSQSQNRYLRNGQWYDIKFLKISSENGLNEFEFELKGDRYKFVDDEEQQGWCENIKLFSLFLYDDAGRCLIEIPMKVRVDKRGRAYSITSDGPNAFLPGEWSNDFINVKLKNQSIRNREIREQKHQERLSEIEDLRNRFGFWE